MTNTASDPWKPNGWSNRRWRAAHGIWSKWQPKNWRWRVADLVNKLPGTCWVDLVQWSQDGTREAVARADTWKGALPLSSNRGSCRDDMAREGCCYCGKLQTAEFRAEMERVQAAREADR